MKRILSVLVILLWASIACGGMQAPRKLVNAASGGGSASFSDNFNRSDENPIASPWAASTGWSTLKIASNAIYANGEQCLAYYNSTTSANQYSQIEAPEGWGGVGYGVVVRVQSGSKAGYLLWRYDTSSVQLRLYDGSSSSAIGSCSSASFTGGAVMRIEISGSSIVGKVGGTTVCTATDSTLSSGYTGIWLLDINQSIDNWWGGDL